MRAISVIHFNTHYRLPVSCFETSHQWPISTFRLEHPSEYPLETLRAVGSHFKWCQRKSEKVRENKPCKPEVITFMKTTRSQQRCSLQALISDQCQM